MRILHLAAKVPRLRSPVSSTLGRMENDLQAIAAVMVHMPDPVAGLAWYAQAFPDAGLHRLEEHDFEFLHINGVRIEVVQADEKVSCGAAGTVIYWQVASFDAALKHLNAQGATLFRGPMNIEDGQRMCQVRDPWGNCIGIRGK